jgi:hypothetical protein
MPADGTEIRDIYENYTEISLNSAMQDPALQFHVSKATAPSY